VMAEHFGGVSTRRAEIYSGSSRARQEVSRAPAVLGESWAMDPGAIRPVKCSL